LSRADEIRVPKEKIHVCTKQIPERALESQREALGGGSLQCAPALDNLSTAAYVRSRRRR
jgi:hypothetical protein